MVPDDAQNKARQFDATAFPGCTRFTMCFSLDHSSARFKESKRVCIGTAELESVGKGGWCHPPPERRLGGLGRLEEATHRASDRRYILLTFIYENERNGTHTVVIDPTVNSDQASRNGLTDGATHDPVGTNGRRRESRTCGNAASC